jgi:5-methylcytosine-specific restriction endonuclease McrA
MKKHANNTQPRKSEIKTKWCNICKRGLPVACFHKRCASKDGLAATCKECCKSYARRYHKENAETIKAKKINYNRQNAAARAEKGRQYYQINKESILEKRKNYRKQNRRRILEWKDNNKERIQAYNKTYLKSYYSINKKVFADKAREYARKHPERVRTYKANNRIMRTSAAGYFSATGFASKCEYWGWRCYLCNASLSPQTVTIEHRKPLSRSGCNWLSNIAPACKKCNRAKGVMTESEYRRLVDMQR